MSPDNDGKIRFARQGEANYYGAWTKSVNAPVVSSDYGGGSAFFYGFNPGWPNSTGVSYVGNSVTMNVSQTLMGQWIKYELPTWGLAASDNDPKPAASSSTTARIREARSFSRALLTMPFDKLYKKEKDGSLTKMPHLDKFREYIDGIEAYSGTSADNKGKPTFMNNELFPISANYIASMVYGGRPGAPAVTPDSGGTGMYHHGRYGGLDNSTATNYLIRYADATTSSGITYNNAAKLYLDKMTLNSGQVAGSIIDFFSPLSPTGTGTVTANGLSFSGNEGFFPVTGSCQQNWVVLFVSGNEALKHYTPSYTTADAVFKLFKNTLTMRGRKLNENEKWEEKKYDMDSGVRTIVIGFVDEKSGSNAEIIQGLNDTAAWGDPILDKSTREWKPDYKRKPYFVTNVSELTKAIEDVLNRVSVAGVDSGSPVSIPGLESTNPDGTREVFGTSYRIHGGDQWKAGLKKSVYNKNDIVPEKSWEADEIMMGQAENDERSLYTWLSETTTEITKINLKSHAGVPTDIAAASFDTWLHKFDVLDTRDASKDIGVLGDMQHSNIMVVGRPKAKTLRDKEDESNIKRPHIVYVQTNRGFLHAIGYDDGKEKWGFVPPNIFKDRLKNLKFNGDVFNEADSTPMYLLDGMLTANDVRTGVQEYRDDVLVSTYKTILTGYLGRGGNGFYAMDITNDNVTGKPNFLWAIENTSYIRGKETKQEVVGWGKADEANGPGGGPDKYDYSNLGLTITPGVIVSPKNGESEIGILPGGMGHRIKDNTPDKKYKYVRGDSFYFFDPNTGAIIQEIDDAKCAGFDLGMGVTPINFKKDGKNDDGLDIAVSFYTADSNGNILYCKLEGVEEGSWELKRKFRLLTIPDSSANYLGGEPVVIPHALVIGKSDMDHEWVFGGTADIDGPGSNTSADRVISNDQQFIFGLNITKIGAENLQTENLARQKYFKDGIQPPYPDLSNEWDEKDSMVFSADTRGWYIMLRPEIPRDTVNNVRGTKQEYVSAPPFMFKGYLIVATFIPFSEEGVYDDVGCVEIGNAKLYVLNPSTGYPVVDPFVLTPFLKNVKIVGFAGLGDNLEMSLQELVPNSGSGVPKIVFPAVASMPTISPNIPYIQYWREKFQ